MFSMAEYLMHGPRKFIVDDLYSGHLSPLGDVLEPLRAVLFLLSATGYGILC